jgi:hypothetical protein
LKKNQQKLTLVGILNLKISQKMNCKFQGARNMKKATFGLMAATAFSGLTAKIDISFAGPKIVDGHYCHNNDCKGKSACGGYGNENGCHYSNDCKTKGWLEADNKETCEKKKGKWTAVSNTPKEEKKAKPEKVDREPAMNEADKTKNEMKEITK